MSERTYKVGDVLKNSVNQFTKIISIHSNRYGLSGWTTRVNAEKATVARIFLNVYGMEAAQIEIVKGASKGETASSSRSTGEKPTKSSLNKLNATAVKELAGKLGIDNDGTRAVVLERLYTHFEL
jgi:hypothetical protein